MEAKTAPQSLIECPYPPCRILFRKSRHNKKYCSNAHRMAHWLMLHPRESPQDPDLPFGAIVKDYRTRKQITLEQLAKIAVPVKPHHSIIQRIEAGKSNPLAEAFRICEALGLELIVRLQDKETQQRIKVQL